MTKRTDLAIKFVENELGVYQSNSSFMSPLLNWISRISLTTWVILLSLLTLGLGWSGIHHFAKRKTPFMQAPTWILAGLPVWILLVATTVWHVLLAQQSFGTISQTDISTRTGPTLDAPTLTSLNEGARVQILKTHNDWLQITSNDSVPGWVLSKSVINGKGAFPMIKLLWENVLNKKHKESDVFEFLKQSFLFKDLNRTELEFISKIVHIRSFRPGEKIFKQGDPGVGMYLILNGTVDIIMYDPTHEGRETKDEIFITRLEKGDFFGELSLIEDPSFRSASSMSVNRSILIGFFKPDLMQVIQRNPLSGNKISLRLAEILGKRLRETTEKVTELISELNAVKRNSGAKGHHDKHFTS